MRTYGIMIAYVRDNDCVRTGSLLRTYGIIIAYVRDTLRTYEIMIEYVRDHYYVRTGSLLRTYGIMIAYVRDHYRVRTGYCHYFFFFLCPLWVFVVLNGVYQLLTLLTNMLCSPPEKFPSDNIFPGIRLTLELQSKNVEKHWVNYS